ncbi:MAG: molybdenum cofactor guanylyltransferase [Chloroflexi bacterium]|nr:molybdenum cofactor guanylyltransferase [Chloroflexota bacterium]
MTSIVLAGGKSQRLGRDKAWEKVGGESLIQRVVSRLTPLSTELIVVMAQGQHRPTLNANIDIRLASDIYPGCGSMGGIYTGLTLARSFHSVVVACDMPFLVAPLLRYMIELSPDYDVVVPRAEKGLEPLHAIYSKNCLAPMRTSIQDGRLRVVDVLSKVRVRYVEQEEIDRFDRERLSFLNVNTPLELERARDMADQYETLKSGEKETEQG